MMKGVPSSWGRRGFPSDDYGWTSVRYDAAGNFEVFASFQIESGWNVEAVRGDVLDEETIIVTYETRLTATTGGGTPILNNARRLNFYREQEGTPTESIGTLDFEGELFNLELKRARLLPDGSGDLIVTTRQRRRGFSTGGPVGNLEVDDVIVRIHPTEGVRWERRFPLNNTFLFSNGRQALERSPDGERLFTGEMRGNEFLFVELDVTTGETLRDFLGMPFNSGFFSDATYAADGRIVVGGLYETVTPDFNFTVGSFVAYLDEDLEVVTDNWYRSTDFRLVSAVSYDEATDQVYAFEVEGGQPPAVLELDATNLSLTFSTAFPGFTRTVSFGAPIGKGPEGRFAIVLNGINSYLRLQELTRYLFRPGANAIQQHTTRAATLPDDDAFVGVESHSEGYLLIGHTPRADSNHDLWFKIVDGDGRTQREAFSDDPRPEYALMTDRSPEGDYVVLVHKPSFAGQPDQVFVQWWDADFRLMQETNIGWQNRFLGRNVVDLRARTDGRVAVVYANEAIVIGRNRSIESEFTADLGFGVTRLLPLPDGGFVTLGRVDFSAGEAMRFVRYNDEGQQIVNEGYLPPDAENTFPMVSFQYGERTGVFLNNFNTDQGYLQFFDTETGATEDRIVYLRSHESTLLLGRLQVTEAGILDHFRGRLYDFTGNVVNLQSPFTGGFHNDVLPVGRNAFLGVGGSFRGNSRDAVWTLFGYNQLILSGNPEGIANDLVYPNPNRGVFKFRIGSAALPGEFSYRILDGTGREWAAGQLTNPPSSFDISNEFSIYAPELPGGMYTLRLDGTNEPVAVPFVVLR